MGMMLERSDPDQMDMGFGGWHNVSEASLMEILEIAGAYAVSEEEMSKHVYSLIFRGRRMQRHPPVMAGIDESILGIVKAFDGWLYDLEDLLEQEISVVGGWLSGVNENIRDAIYKLKDGDDIPEYFYESEDPFMHMDLTGHLSPSAARYLIAISEWFDEVSTELLHIADTLFSWKTFDLSEYQAADFLERSGILEQEQIDSTIKEAHRLGRRLEFKLVPKARETLEYTREVYAAVYGEDEVFRISQMEKYIDQAIDDLLSEAEDPFMGMDFGSGHRSDDQTDLDGELLRDELYALLNNSELEVGLQDNWAIMKSFKLEVKNHSRHGRHVYLAYVNVALLSSMVVAIVESPNQYVFPKSFVKEVWPQVHDILRRHGFEWEGPEPMQTYGYTRPTFLPNTESVDNVVEREDPFMRMDLGGDMRIRKNTWYLSPSGGLLHARPGTPGSLDEWHQVFAEVIGDRELWWEPKFGWSNLPKVVVFNATDIEAKEVKNHLRQWWINVYGVDW